MAQNRPPQRDMGQRAQTATPNRPHQQAFLNVPADVRSEIHIAVFDEYLNLTDDQKQKLVLIDTDFAAKRAALLDNSQPGKRNNNRGLMRTLSDEHQKAIHDLLTKEQYAMFLEKRGEIQDQVQLKMLAYLSKN